MALTTEGPRRRAYGQDAHLTPVDRLGVWLSLRQIQRWVPASEGLRLADIGCGYHAATGRSMLGRLDRLIVLDVALDPALEALPKVTAVEGHLPTAMLAIEDAAADVVICSSVLEHLWEPQCTLSEVHRILAPGGAALVNVPSWRGKWFLELSAFRFALSPAHEVDDHKTYYDPRDLWPMLVRAGFAPSNIRCFRHKLGLNTFAFCRKPGRPVPGE
jgi:SAM-dependent methyltransferase